MEGLYAGEDPSFHTLALKFGPPPSLTKTQRGDLLQ